MSRLTRRVIVALALALATASLVEATPYADVRLSTNAGTQTWFDPSPPMQIPETCFSGTIRGEACGSVSAPAGSLGASATAIPQSPTDFPASSARARLWDEFTLLGLAPNTPVDIEVGFAVAGTLTASGSLAGARVGADISSDPSFVFAFNSALLSHSISSGSQVISDSASRTFTFLAGQPLGLWFVLDVGAFNGAATADFGSTAWLSFSLPPGTSIQSTGGYSQGASAVPEPTAMLVLGSGLLGLAGLRRLARRRHTARRVDRKAR